MAKSSYCYQPVDSVEKHNTNQELLNKIEAIVIEFSGYGYRRVTKHLQRLGISVNHKRVLRLMREHGLIKKSKRRYVRTIDSNHGYRVYPNLMKNVTVEAPNQVWVSDITYVRLAYGFAYLAAVIDRYSRKVIGYAVSNHIDSRSRAASITSTGESSANYIDILNEYGLLISMLRRGNPFDNAYAESFLKTLKYEEVYLTEYRTLAEARISLESSIVDVYNKKRLHSGIGYLPPEEYERQITSKTDNSQNILTLNVPN